MYHCHSNCISGFTKRVIFYCNFQGEEYYIDKKNLVKMMVMIFHDKLVDWQILLYSISGLHVQDDTVKPVSSDHIYDKIHYLWFIQ